MLQPGTVVDDQYRIVCLLGSGANAHVYRAIDQNLDRTVALKWMHSDRGINRETEQRFLREAKLISLLRHPNILQCYEFNSWQGSLYACVDFFEGESLAKLLSRGKLPWRRALRICIEVAKAMEHAHSQGVIHRDLTPRNILVACDEKGIDSVRVIDFGLGKLVAQPADWQKLTQTGDLIGSVYSMSPEQCLGRPVDGRSDIYSLGCVLIHCLTGEPPFLALDAVAVMHKHLEQSPPMVLSALEERDCPSDIQTVIDHAVAKEPDDRQQSMHELREQLETVLAGGKVKAKAMRPIKSPRPVAVMVLAMVGLLLAGALLFPGQVLLTFLSVVDPRTACAIGANTSSVPAFFNADRNAVTNQCCVIADRAHLVNGDTVKLYAMRAEALPKQGLETEASGAAIAALRALRELSSRSDQRSISEAEAVAPLVLRAIPPWCRDGAAAELCFFIAQKCKQPAMRQGYFDAGTKILAAEFDEPGTEFIANLHYFSGNFNNDPSMIRRFSAACLRTLRAMSPEALTVDAYCRTAMLLDYDSADRRSVIKEGLALAKKKPFTGKWSEKMLQCSQARQLLKENDLQGAEACLRRALEVGELDPEALPEQKEVLDLLNDVARRRKH